MMTETQEITIENISTVLQNDTRIKVAGVDTDGVLRGKVMAKEKFLSTVENGFGFSSAIFGWDMHDELYTKTDATSTNEGYPDLTAIPDLRTFRRLISENNMPFFLLRFYIDGKPVPGCARGLLKSVADQLANDGYEAKAGVELEFMNFQTPSEDGYSDTSARRNVAKFLINHSPASLRPLSEGMFGYSLLRPLAVEQYFYDIFDGSEKFKCDIEGWHTESGPTFEAALRVRNIDEMADRVSLFKLLVKTIGIKHSITPCFMSKPLYGLPGNSGHIHLSLTDKQGNNLFARESIDNNAKWPDIAHLSTIGRQFLAGLLDAIPDMFILLAPTVNSYKRLVENYWAPVDLNWGFEDRMASVRLIAPPSCGAYATRFEIRIPGADINPHFALAALTAAGLRGIKKSLELNTPPLSALKKTGKPSVNLPRTLDLALKRFAAQESIAREVLGSPFVDFFAWTREHELKVWRETVTDWEFRRYIETI
ncbi:putative glutamine synthetase [Talaromyces proteolyticus]|uniref:Glutamine synthetase n=1 Tax=Talaromyces proteolyticus TaxID=1131652 RepID=A0AAD4PUM8_9EURO|nr:putative glutamine synthetase [Talaromyces proteolyticus]KAH8690267.1 putative glutamine synthetase [Talaromyces proteolyticus]